MKLQVIIDLEYIMSPFFPPPNLKIMEERGGRREKCDAVRKRDNKSGNERTGKEEVEEIHSNKTQTRPTRVRFPEEDTQTHHANAREGTQRAMKIHYISKLEQNSVEGIPPSARLNSLRYLSHDIGRISIRT